MKIGLIVAIETDSVFAYYKDYETLACPIGYKVYLTKRNGNDIYILKTGMGESASASGTQYLITAFGVDVIVNFGVVGGLSTDMKKQKVCLIEKVVHYRYDCSEFLPLAVGQVDGYKSVYLDLNENLISSAQKICPDLPRAICCSGDRFVGKEEDKIYLNKTFNGDVCDMEAAGIVLTCDLNGVPCLMFKAVSDGLSGGAREFFEELKDASLLCLSVADKVMANISEKDLTAEVKDIKRL